MASIEKRAVHTKQRMLAIQFARENSREEPIKDDWLRAMHATRHEYARAMGWSKPLGFKHRR